MAQLTHYSSPPAFSVGDGETVIKCVRDAVVEYPDRVMYERPTPSGEWEDLRAHDFFADVLAVARGLVASGVEPGDRVALMARTRFEWQLIDFAIWAAGGVTVPIYDSSSGDQIHWILEDSGAVVAVFETPAMRGALESKGAPETLTTSWVIEPEAGPFSDDAAVPALMALGRDAAIPADVIDERIAAGSASDVASLVYTSGTTGRPKGCCITHRNLLFEARGLKSMSIGEVASPGNRVIMFLPLAHVLARAVSVLAVLYGARQTFWSDFSTVVREFSRVRPNTVLGVPRVFEKVHSAAKKKAGAKGAVGKLMFHWAELTAIEYSHVIQEGKRQPLNLRVRKAIFDKLVYSNLRSALGNECWWGISGGGALNARLGHFFRGVGVPIYEGYGLTESTAAHTVNTPGEIKIGTVGRPMPGNSARIAEDGEIELHGGTIFDGYWRNEEATAQVLSDGWFRTGDLGSIDADGYLSITGRKKDLLVTAGGKNISPGPLEDILRTQALISEAVVIGDGMPFIACLVTLDHEAVRHWLENLDRDPETPIADLINDEALRAEIQVTVNEANETVSHAESIKKFAILPRDFTGDDGELTATLKVKRPVVNEHFKDEIISLYHPGYKKHH